MSTVTTLQVRRDQLAQTRLVQHPSAALAQGQVRVCVERFALTSNNITYAAFGERMGYWQFFPSGEDGWGVVPVWGFGTVTQSLHPNVAVGERLYGYFPMADSVVLQPGRLLPGRMAEESPHRAALPVVYNQYFRCAADPLYTPDSEDLQALLRPLFITSWLIDDFFDDNGFFGARPGTALLSSASSKTAWGTAFLMHQRPGTEVVGITSPANRAYCESLGCYHRVLAYDQLDQVAADAPCVYIDFAGSGEVRGAARHLLLRAGADQEASGRMGRRGLRTAHGAGLAISAGAGRRSGGALAAGGAPPRPRSSTSRLRSRARWAGQSARRTHPFAAGLRPRRTAMMRGRGDSWGRSAARPTVAA
jgi:hypothetical protein